MSITGTQNYFEDFAVGDIYLHQRGRTVTEMDNVMLTNLVMNTAELHFNQDLMERTPNVFNNQRVVYGGIVLAMVVGLASQDTSENAIAEVAMDDGRHTAPVFHGDTLYAESEVLAKRDSDRPYAGIVRFKLRGRNQRGQVVVEIEREVLILKRQTS